MFLVSRFAATAVILIGFLHHSHAQQRAPSGIKFEVISVKLLDDEEAARRTPKDVIGLDVAVRLRLSCSEKSLQYYTWGNSIIPLGYRLRSTNSGFVWLLYERGNIEPSRSPGIEALDDLVPGTWRLMTPADRTVIEWDVFDSTKFAGAKHAKTIFIRTADSKTPIEIVSDLYVVPSR